MGVIKGREPQKACPDCKVVHTAASPTLDCPAVLFGELIEEIESAMASQPRSLQKRIGPSEVGEPCSRALAYKLAGVDEPRRIAGPDDYRAWVGSRMHEGFERIFGRLPRYQVETKVSVGHINGVEITGHNDLFDVESGTVWDWKTKGLSRLQEAERNVRLRNNPGQVYRVQQHLYGRGRVHAGYTVKRVAIFYTPRDGNLRDSFYWSEPYDEQVAIDALDRATGIAQLTAALGIQATVDMYPLCDEEFCDWCGPKRKAKALADLAEKRAAAPPTSVRELIARG